MATAEGMAVVDACSGVRSWTAPNSLCLAWGPMHCRRHFSNRKDKGRKIVLGFEGGRRLGGCFNLCLCDLGHRYGSDGSDRPKPKQAEFAMRGKEILNIGPGLWA